MLDTEKAAWKTFKNAFASAVVGLAQEEVARKGEDWYGLSYGERKNLAEEQAQEMSIKLLALIGVKTK